MTAWVRIFGGLALNAALVLLGAMSMLVLARDVFHVFVHPALSSWIKLGEGVVDGLFEPMLRQFDAPQFRYPHLVQAVVLLALGFGSYAHARRDFAMRPATSAFLYLDALACTLFGAWALFGVLALFGRGPDGGGFIDALILGSSLAALLLFQGLGDLWRVIFQAGGLWSRLLSLLLAAARLFAGVLSLVFAEIFASSTFRENQGLGLQIVALTVLVFGVWACVFGFHTRQSAPAPQGEGARSIARWIERPGRKWGFGVLATFGLAASLAWLGQTAWEVERVLGAPRAGAGAGVFRDCPDCPEMTVIPGGSFTTAAAQGEQMPAAGGGTDETSAPYERRARAINVPAFAMARREVTVSQFQAFIDATGYRPTMDCRGQRNGAISWRHPGFAQRPDHPVVCVTWWDAQAYIRWLSLRTGAQYRLPNEEEWEYAARAGSRTAYYWGDDVTAACTYVNGADEGLLRAFPYYATFPCHDGAVYTAAVASYQPNAFGLSDMIGNVWEWVDSRGGCEPDIRCFRGGSWINGPQVLRIEVLDGAYPTFSYNTLGFRVARSI